MLEPEGWRVQLSSATIGWNGWRDEDLKAPEGTYPIVVFASASMLLDWGWGRTMQP